MGNAARHSIGGLKGSRTSPNLVYKRDLLHRTVHKAGQGFAHSLLAALIEGGEQISLQIRGDFCGRTSIRVGLEEMLDDVCQINVATLFFNPASTNRARGSFQPLDARAAKAVLARHQGCRLVHDFVAENALHALRHFRECVFEDSEFLLRRWKDNDIGRLISPWPFFRCRLLWVRRRRPLAKRTIIFRDRHSCACVRGHRSTATARPQAIAAWQLLKKDAAIKSMALASNEVKRSAARVHTPIRSSALMAAVLHADRSTHEHAVCRYPTFALPRSLGRVVGGEGVTVLSFSANQMCNFCFFREPRR